MNSVLYKMLILPEEESDRVSVRVAIAVVEKGDAIRRWEVRGAEMYDYSSLQQAMSFTLNHGITMPEEEAVRLFPTFPKETYGR